MIKKLVNRDEPNLRLSIIIPAYNEAQRIGPTLEEHAAVFAGLYGDRFEVIAVLNGCTDGTKEVVESTMLRSPQIRFLEFSDLHGKGGAIMKGFSVARGDTLVFVDADNMVRASETARLVTALELTDLAIADRFSGLNLDGEQPLIRKIPSKVLRLWTRLFLRLPFHDTQCGAKAFKASAWHAVQPYIREKGWAFDMDVLSTAKNLGLNIAEIPIEWRHVAEGSKVRIWVTGPQLLCATLRLKFRRN